MKEDRMPAPPCPECEWLVIRDVGGTFVRYSLYEPCDEHYEQGQRGRLS